MIPLPLGALGVEIKIRVSTGAFAGTAVTAAVLRIRKRSGELAFWPVTWTTEDFAVVLSATTEADYLDVYGEIFGRVWLTIGGIERSTADVRLINVTDAIPRA